MLFNSVEYIIFLPIVFAIYWLLRKNMKWQNVVLLLASYVFYAWWDYRFLLLLIGMSVIAFACGKAIDRSRKSIDDSRKSIDGAIRKDLMSVGYSWIDAYIPMARYWGYQSDNKRGLLEFLNLKHYCDYPSYKGHMPDPDPWEPNRLHYSDSIPSYVDEGAKTVFLDFVDKCEESGVQLIFVTSPVYCNYVDMSPDWNRYVAWYDSIASANDIPYFNYTDHPICRDSTLFNAGFHLTPDGTKRWSEILSKDLMDKQIIK